MTDEQLETLLTKLCGNPSITDEEFRVLARAS